MSLPPESRTELATEQTFVDAAYARLDAMRRSAAQVSEAYADVRRGGTHQARLERDIAVEVTHRRLAALDIGEAPLVFGRLDLDRDPNLEPYFHVGRVAVDDEDHTPLVVDWRAPVAEPFYRATAVEPMGVVRRRHFVTRRGRELIALDDEVFDARASEDAGYTVVGEGALLSALERSRTGRMGDIVATIQAEQDDAIRADLPGVLVVAGGAGTGKTAVALHRAAYLLYTYRRQLQGQGVLLVGPSRIFLRYIDQVLPSLGEHDVQLATLAALKPMRLHGADPVHVAVVKGDARMATVIAKAMRDRERALPRDIVVTLDGIRLRITRAFSERVVERARRRRGTHNAKRRLVVQAVVDHLVGRYRAELAAAYDAQPLFADPELDEADPTVAAALARGEAPPEDWERELRARLRRQPGVREALERMWPVLSGTELVHDLFSFEALVRSASAGVLDPAEERGLFRPRSPSVDEVAWSEADVALVDEADALLGPRAAAAPPRRRTRAADDDAFTTASRVIEEMGLAGRTDARALAERFAETPADGRSESDPAELRTYGHILVDEAQDLTPMQWRMLGRRATSFTLVGDFGQASRVDSASGWDAALAQLPQRVPPRLATLSVNYRTPAEIMEVAHRILAVAAPQVEPTRAVRSTGDRPTFVASSPHDLVGEAVRLARVASAAGGTVAVIAPRATHDELARDLADIGAVADSPEALDAPIAVLEATDAKGLEFDHVIVVEPAALVAADPAGLRLLYVILTRATRTLAVVHAEPLPEALEPARRLVP